MKFYSYQLLKEPHSNENLAIFYITVAHHFNLALCICAILKNLSPTSPLGPLRRAMILLIWLQEYVFTYIILNWRNVSIVATTTLLQKLIPPHSTQSIKQIGFSIYEKHTQERHGIITSLDDYKDSDIIA